MQEGTESLSLKLVIIGDVNTGKTSLLQRYCLDQFEDEDLLMASTIGLNFHAKFIKGFEGNDIRLQLWDIAGSLPLYLLIYDIIQDRTESFGSPKRLSEAHQDAWLYPTLPAKTH